VELHRHRLLVLADTDRDARAWSLDDVPPGPHLDTVLVCGCCEAPVVYGWLPEELTALVRCDDCGCTLAASEAGAVALSGRRLAREYVKA